MGASIGYWQGDITKIMDDIECLKPTFFVGVPRVYDRIYSRVMDQVIPRVFDHVFDQVFDRVFDRIYPRVMDQAR